MTPTALLRAAVLALLVFLGTVRTAPRAADEKPADPGPSPDDFRKLTEKTGRQIESALQGNPNRPARDQAQAAAVLLAALAQSHAAGKEAQQWLTVRDAALQVADLVRKGKLAEARRQAAGLAALPADPQAKKGARPLLGPAIGFAEVMAFFGPDAGNGEKKLRDLVNNAAARKAKALPAAALTDDLLVLAYQASALGELSKAHKNAKVQKNPKAWQRYAEETQAAGLQLAAAIRDAKDDRAWTALNRLQSACAGCHSDFDR